MESNHTGTRVWCEAAKSASVDVQGFDSDNDLEAVASSKNFCDKTDEH